MQRIREVESASLRKLERKPSKSWDDLERVLAEAVMDVVAGRAKRELQNYQNEMLRYNIPFYGSVPLWHVFQQFQLDGGTALAVELSNPMGLQFGGGLEGFMTAWDTCVQ